MTATGGNPPEAPSAFPWDAVLALGLGALGWSPEAFWSASPRELAAAAGFARSDPPMGRGDLATLLARHPDDP